MDVKEEIIIVGAGIAGLATSLGLHRMGLSSIVLEASDKLRSSGFGFLTWTNAWKALDALGIGDTLRDQHIQLQRLIATSTATGLETGKRSFTTRGKHGDHEVRCVKRHLLLESLENELPRGTIRLNSKVVSIEEEAGGGRVKVLHLADGTTLKAKVLIGCDGVNSMVAKWLGLKRPSYSGRSAARGITEYPEGHGFKPEFLQYFGDGFRSGFLPCDDKNIYWFFTWSPSPQEEEVERDPMKMKQFVLSKLGKVPQQVSAVVERCDLSSLLSSHIVFRSPLNILFGNISKANVCVAGDALHPMTPDLGQGACSALEDGVVLARCLGEALKTTIDGGGGGEQEQERIEKGLKRFAEERRWRAFGLVGTAYAVGLLQQSDGPAMNFLRDKLLSGFMAGLLLSKADFDCGRLGVGH
ncbi:hypothetical protein QJS04_geneDACA001256 [Acorus gramineus]|uniref:FAD-binding domain-containing protein n=1 Tax=Acorus gramineus TaxID=55184 RepID=A0AAV9ACC3_ACOGR|nr:hypothetical protein QJS04_geneDACA001256 [Acorus gramineus]